MAQSVFVVRVPEAEPWVAHLRERFDPAARRGLGAHITVLYPFMAPDRIDQRVLDQVRAVTASVAPFDYQLGRVARFPGTLYLAADPAAPFHELNARLVREFREFLPDLASSGPLVPHLSVARKSDADDREVEAELNRALAPHGPIACECCELTLIENTSGSWRPLQVFALG